MSIADQINLSSAEAAYVVANTPHYLIRRLEADKNVRLLNHTLRPEEIVSEFKSCISQDPLNVRDAVTPYVCLVALSFLDDLMPLKMTTGFVPSPAHKWVDYIRRVLIENYQSRSHKTFRVSTPIDPGFSIGSEGPITRIAVDLRR